MELGLSERGQSLTAGAPGCCWSDLGPLSSLLSQSVWCLKPFYPLPRLASLNILVFSCFITSIIDPWYCADITQTFSQRLDKTRLHCDGLNSNQPSDGRWGRFNYVSMLSAGATREAGPLGPGHHTGSLHRILMADHCYACPHTGHRCHPHFVIGSLWLSWSRQEITSLNCQVLPSIIAFITTKAHIYYTYRKIFLMSLMSLHNAHAQRTTYDTYHVFELSHWERSW